MMHRLAVCSGALFFILFAAAAANGQISPGPLSEPHAMLNGPQHCTDCHDSARRPPGFKCLDCHAEIRARLDAGTGLHAPMMKTDKSSEACIACHSEHNGAGFAIVHWDPPQNRFDHRRAGYRLEGRHAAVGCRTCHDPKNIPAARKKSLPKTNLTRTFLGLSKDCATCHADVHQGQLSPRCDQCHTPADWRPATGFDHRRARFSLLGAHRNVACEKCHKVVSDDKPYVRYRGLSFQDCTPCHQDPHHGTFQAACHTCHESAAAWKPVRIKETGFDHAHTRFPLLGKHASIACSSCHKSADFKVPLAFERCDDCHKSDPHRGQFAGRPDGGDCASCHTVTGFKPATFGVQQHDATSFPLRGKHRETQCVNCHVARAGRIEYRQTSASCVSCHADVHGGQFLQPPYENDCLFCHSETSFQPSTFTLERHAATKYPLTGAHAKVPCAQCHRRDNTGGTNQPARFHFDDRTCTACHADPHGNQFGPLMKAALLDGSPAGCRVCHTTSAWSALQGFDHGATSFPLTGAHQSVPCAQCHRPENPADGIRGVHFTSAPHDCASCHRDVHQGQFSAGSQPAVCSRCHDADHWKPALYDHNAQSGFKLEGAHESVPCLRCHKSATSASGTEWIVYTGTPRECSRCHADVHGGQFSAGDEKPVCSRCHQTLTWKPSTFDHNTQSEFKLEGAHRSVPCVRCHTAVRQVAGASAVWFRAAPRECSACHRLMPLGSPS